MSIENTLNEIIEVLDNCVPPHITLSSVESGTIDLTDMLNEFDAEVKNILGINDYDPESNIDSFGTLSQLIGMVEASETITQVPSITRGDLLKYLLEVLSQRILFVARIKEMKRQNEDAVFAYNNEFQILPCSYNELINNFCINDQSEIFLRLGTRWNDSFDYNVHEYLDSIFPCFRNSQTTPSSYNQTALLQSREIGIDDLQIEFFEKAWFYRDPDKPPRHIKQLGIKGDPQIIINLCIKLNELILSECSEPSYSILIQSENKVAAISSVKNEDDLFLFHDIEKREGDLRIDKYFWDAFSSEVALGLTEDECPDLDTFKLRWKKDLEDRNYSEEEIMRILRYEKTYLYVRFFQSHLSSRHGEDFRFD